MTITQAQDAPLIVVGGATGNQGGSVIRFLSESPKPYRIRALTRDVTKPNAKRLAEQGVEVISVSLDAENKAKVIEAYKGADVVFSVTNFWEHLNAQRESDEGKAMIDAAIEAGVKLFIFSALPSLKKYSGGKYSHVYHFESKAEIDEYGKSKNSDTFKFRVVHAGFYNSNMLGQQIIKKDASGSWKLQLPIEKETRVPFIDIDEYGLWVRALIENQAAVDDGRPVLSVGEWASLDEAIKSIEKKTGTTVAYEKVDDETFKKSLPDFMPPHIVTDLAETWLAFQEFGYYGGEDTKWILPYLSRKPSLFAEWAERTDLKEFSV